MEELIDKILVNIQKAYATWGYWCLLIIAATFVVMIGVNALMKLIFKKATSSQMQGLRKALSGCSAFAVSIGMIYLFGFFDKRYGLCSGIDYTTGLVLSNCAPIAFCSMTLWAIVKAVGRVGILPLFAAIGNKLRKPFQKILEQIPMSKELRESVFAKIEQLLTDSATASNTDICDYINNNTVTINRKVAALLSGIVDTNTVADCTDLFIQAIKAKYPIKEEKKNGD